MSIAERSPNIESPGEQPAEIKSIVASSVIGTAVEWYDFLIYGATSALAFNKLDGMPHAGKLKRFTRS